MIHIGREMIQMMQAHMGNRDMMSGGGIGMTNIDVMYHFRTGDTASTGAGR